MAKVLRIAAIVVAIAAAIPSGGTSLLGTSLASAGITAAGGAALSAATTGLIASAVGLASGFVTALTAKAPSLQGGQTEWQSDPNGPGPIVFGDTLVGESVIYRKVTSKDGGTKNKYQFLGGVISCCGPIAGIDDILVDKVSTSFSGDNAVGDLNGRVYVRTQLGACPETSALIPTGPWPSIPDWGSASKLSGMAAAMACYVFDGKGSKTFTQVPTTQFRVRGVLCYDPREDSTYPGGSGAQRWDDQDTWAYSTNPWIQAITYARGWFQGPNSIRVGGVGMTFDSIDLDAYIEAANVADANGWVSGGSVKTTDDKWDALKALCQAGGGEPVRLGATLSCIVNTPRISIGTIGIEDLVGSASITTTQPRRDRINGIVPTYRSEDHDFEQVPAGVVRNSAYLAADGGRERTKAVTYPMIQCYAGDTPDQAAQIAGYDIANAREAGPIVLPLKPRWLGYRAGDCLTIEDRAEFGYLRAKEVLVLRRQLDPSTGGVVLTFRTETGSKHSWALGLVGVPAPTTSDNPVPVVEAPDADDVSIATTIDFLEGLPTGTIALSLNVTDDTAEHVVIEYRENGAADWNQSAVLDVSATDHEITGLDVMKTWDVAVSYFSELRLMETGISFNTTTADTAQVTADNAFLTADRA